MPVCFAPGCNSGYVSAIKRNKASGTRNPSLFCAPKDSGLLEIWQKVIPRKDKVFTNTDKLCELHFQEECIERVYKTTLPDGSVFALDRGRSRLKPGSIPTIFHNLPKYLSGLTSKVYKRSTPVPCSSSFKKTQKPEVNVIEEVKSHTKIQQQQNCYLELFHHLENIEKPDPWWTVESTEEYIICVKWNSKYSYERRVVVSQDSSTKIFLGNIEILLDVKAHSSENLSVLLQCVNDLIVCENVESGRPVSCLGYSSEREKQTMCSACSEFLERLQRHSLL